MTVKLLHVHLHKKPMPAWQRRHLPRRPGRKAIARGNAMLAPKGKTDVIDSVDYSTGNGSVDGDADAC